MAPHPGEGNSLIGNRRLPVLVAPLSRLLMIDRYGHGWPHMDSGAFSREPVRTKNADAPRTLGSATSLTMKALDGQRMGTSTVSLTMATFGNGPR
jgi:hypothetical protein